MPSLTLWPCGLERSTISLHLPGWLGLEMIPQCRPTRDVLYGPTKVVLYGPCAQPACTSTLILPAGVGMLTGDFPEPY